MINFINSNDGENFKNGIRNFINLDATIDCMIYTWFIMAGNNVAKNILWTTFDGVHWAPAMYDMDGTFGLHWNGFFNFEIARNDPHQLSIDIFFKSNLLFQKVFDNFFDEIKQRYLELRQGPMSFESMCNKFNNFFNKIPNIVIKAEKEKWLLVPSQDENNFSQIVRFLLARIDTCDTFFYQGT